MKKKVCLQDVLYSVTIPTETAEKMAGGKKELKELVDAHEYGEGIIAEHPTGVFLFAAFDNKKGDGERLTYILYCHPEQLTLPTHKEKERQWAIDAAKIDTLLLAVTHGSKTDYLFKLQRRVPRG